MKYKNILITGGAGYIGSHAAKFFLEKGFNVIIFDNLSRGFLESIKILKKRGPLKFMRGDLKNKNDIEGVFKKNKIDAVIHFAALCSVNESMEKPELYYENNVVGSFNLLESMRKHGVKKIVFSSTCAVYGEAKKLPVSENHPKVPLSPYGESKLAVENMINWYGIIYGMKYVILRYFNVCGADRDGIIGDSKKPSQLLMQNAVRGAMKIESFFYTCQKVGTSDGTPVRDYLDVEDLVEAHYLAFKNMEKFQSGGIFNLGNGNGYSVKEIIEEVEKQFGVKIKKGKGKPRKGEYAKIYADNSKAKKIFGWRPKKGISDSISSLKKWYEKYPNGYKS